QQCHLPGVLDRPSDLALLLGRHTGHPPRADLAPVGDELPQQGGVLVVDVGDPLLVERVHLLLWLAYRRSLSHVPLLQSLWKRRTDQNGGSSSKPLAAPAPAGAAGVADAHGSSTGAPPPNPPPPE